MFSKKSINSDGRITSNKSMTLSQRTCLEVGLQQVRLDVKHLFDSTSLSLHCFACIELQGLDAIT